MISLRSLLLAASCSAWLVPFAASAQQGARALQVTVVDSASGAPILGAYLVVNEDSANSARTDARGRATLRMLDRQGTLRVSARGFGAHEKPIDAGDAEVLIFDVRLAPSVQMLAGREVTGAAGASLEMNRLAGYNRRLAAGRGRFITRTQIVARGGGRVSDLFRGIPSLRVVDSASARLLISSRGVQSSLVSKSANSDCVIPVAVDGLLREGAFQVDLMTPDEIEGIEVFTGVGTIPPEYSSMRKNAWCGLILIWTRDR